MNADKHKQKFPQHENNIRDCHDTDDEHDLEGSIRGDDQLLTLILLSGNNNPVQNLQPMHKSRQNQQKRV